MPPTVITGSKDTRNITQNRLVIDMSSDIGLLKPDDAALLSFLKLAKNKSQTASNPKFEWMEDGLAPRWDAVNNAAGVASGVTTVDVDNGTYFSANDIVKVPRTGEVLLVTAIATNALTVVRGYGVTAAAALVDNDPLVIVGNVNEEFAGIRTMKTTGLTPMYNYTQIWRTPFGVSRTAQRTKLYGPSELSYQQMKKGVEHKKDMERSLIFGERKEDVTGSHPKRATGGALSFLTANNYDAGGLLTQSEFDNNISESVFKYGSKEKILYSSARLLSVINGWALGKLMIDQEAKKFGLSVFKYVTPFGTYNIINGMHTLEGAVYGGYGIILDPENIKYRPLEGSDTTLRTNIQNNDADGRIDEYLTEGGLEVRNKETHAVLTGVTS
jgi:hypothetical protein